MVQKLAASGRSFAFTERRIKDLPTPLGRATWHHDTTTPGLAVSVSPRGKRTWYAIIRGGGRSHRVKIGAWPTLSVAQARTEVRKQVGKVAAGEAVWLRAKTGQRTVADLAARWLTDHAEPAGLRTIGRCRTDIAETIIPALGRVPLSHLRRDQIKSLIAEIQRERGVGAAKRVFGLLSAMLGFAVDQEWLPHSPMVRMIRPDVPPRSRFLKEAELGKFMRAIGKIRSKVGRNVLLMLAFTGQRKGATVRMEWSEIDRDAGTWSIPISKSKAKRPQTVMLTAHALEVLDEMRGDSPRWVFPSPRNPSKHYANPKHAWAQLLKLSGLEDVRPHDVRRSVAVHMHMSGQSVKTVSSALGHVATRVTQRHYLPIEAESIRAAMQTANEAMLAAAKKS